MVIYNSFDSLVSVSFSIGPLCIGFMRAWLSLAGSPYDHTVQLGLGTTMKLLQNLAISTTTSGASIC